MDAEKFEKGREKDRRDRKTRVEGRIEREGGLRRMEDGRREKEVREGERLKGEVEGRRRRGWHEGGMEGTGHCSTPLIPHHYPRGVITHPGHSS